MRPQSPADVIAPAFSRARTVLTPPGFAPGQNAPFRFWFFVKIALVAALTSTGFYGFTIGFALQGFSFATMATGTGIRHRETFLAAPSGASAALLAFALVAGLIGLGLWLFSGWLWCRLRFTLFDLVLYRRGAVGQAWSRYGAPAWRYLGLIILVSLAVLACLAVTAGPLLLHLAAAVRGAGPERLGQNPSLVLAHIFPIYGIFLLFGLLGTLLDAVMLDFLLPPMAIQNAPVAEALGRFLSLAREQPGALALYLLLRFVLEIGLSWIGAVAVLFILGILGLGGAGIGFVLFQALWHAGAAGMAGFLLYCVVAGLALITLYLLAMVCLYGSVAVFRQSYATLFFGSWYPELGDLLEPPQPAAISPSPLDPSPLEEAPPLW